jgi:hypothetical protein
LNRPLSPCSLIRMLILSSYILILPSGLPRDDKYFKLNSGNACYDAASFHVCDLREDYNSLYYVKIITAYTKVYCYCLWLWRLVSHTNGRTQVQIVWEQKTWHLGRTKWLEKVAFEGPAGSIVTHRMSKACHAWETLEMRSQFRLQTLKGRPRRRWEDNRLLLDIEKIG